MPEVYCSLPLDLLREAPYNPRKHFDAAKLAELAESIKAHGVLQPLLCRQNGRFHQVIGGARRLRAAKLAGLAEVPVRIVELTDDAALEVAVIDNLQREDVQPLEEADGFRALLDRPGYDVAAIAARIGKPESYVYRRLGLLRLSAKARTALEEERITDAHAAVLAPLSHERQDEALEWLLEDRGHRVFVGGNGNHVQNLPTAVTLRAYIEQELMLKLAAAPFPVADAELLKKAGACTTCPKRTSAQAALFAEPVKGDHCLDHACWHQKTNAHIQAQINRAKEQGQRLVQIATVFLSGYGDDQKARKAGVLSNSEYTLVGKKRCEHTERGIVVQGRERVGEIIDICRKNGCAVHRPTYGITSGERPFAEVWRRKRQQLDEKIAQARNREVWRQVVAKSPLLPISTFAADQFRAIAAHVVHNLKHDGQLEACAVLALDGEKRKDYNGQDFEQPLLDYYDRLEGEDRFRTVFGWTLISPYRGYTKEMQEWAERYGIDQDAIEQQIAAPLLKDFEAKKARAAEREKAEKKAAKKAATKPETKPAAKPVKRGKHKAGK